MRQQHADECVSLDTQNTTTTGFSKILQEKSGFHAKIAGVRDFASCLESLRESLSAGSIEGAISAIPICGSFHSNPEYQTELCESSQCTLL